MFSIQCAFDKIIKLNKVMMVKESKKEENHRLVHETEFSIHLFLFSKKNIQRNVHLHVNRVY